ncbi:MAG: phosphomannose isomerase type II C-terminal cupin domain, partial [Verrucomicrobiales bacterium]|nr:phosphomannose isomerase type II C-terminal cupin domain [Verrucomicrobiales bacterium]
MHFGGIFLEQPFGWGVRGVWQERGIPNEKRFFACFINEIVDRLQKKYRKESGYHRKVYRPWGWFDSLDKREGFQVKRIYINPGASLSIQSHKYRSEHWVVVKGTAIVLKGDESFILNVNQSTYIS